MRRLVFFIVVFGMVAQVAAQRAFSVLDTVHVEEVVSYGKLKKYQSGAKIEQIDSSVLDIAQDGSMEQLLARTLPVALKSNAGGLATIRIRGTAPDHTSFYFGGLDINSLTLGHSNVSNIPVFLFDNLTVQYGSASSVNGSGSIGGAIHLGIEPQWTKGVSSRVRVAAGAFGEQFYGARVALGNGRFEAVTRFYLHAKKNDFTFMNPNYRDFENGIFEIKDRQHNANVENKGLLQEFNYRFSEAEQLFVRVWLEDDWHLVQQNMQTNLANPNLRVTYADEHVRVWSGYDNSGRYVNWGIRAGYVYDNALYNKNTSDTISTRRVVGELYAEQKISQGISFKLGAKAMRISPNVYAYAETFEHEDRVDFYASLFWKPFQQFTTTLNLRQGYVSDFSVPFTPALGWNYLLYSGENSVFSVNGNVARSYRVPTFNDRFWVPGGNPNLNPEEGMSYELGTKWSYCFGVLSGNLKLNAFFMNVNDWILWKNGGAYWYAENVQKVQSKGLELSTDWKYSLGSARLETRLNYAFTVSERVKSLNETNALNRQLEYVPRHAGNFFSSVWYGNWMLSVDGNYTGKQFTDEEDRNILDSYFLLNVGLGYRWKCNQTNRFRINAQVMNLLDKQYQASWGYAMPGIAWRLGLIYNFN